MGPLLALWIVQAFAADAVIRNVVLTENLEHPPNLEICMRKIFPFEVKRFVGPNLSPDKLRVDYAAIASDGAHFTWRFRPGPGAQWRPFLYDAPWGSAVGVAAESMYAASEIVPFETNRPPIAVDVRPCEAHFRKGH